MSEAHTLLLSDEREVSSVAVNDSCTLHNARSDAGGEFSLTGIRGKLAVAVDSGVRSAAAVGVETVAKDQPDGVLTTMTSHCEGDGEIAGRCTGGKAALIEGLRVPMVVTFDGG